MPGISVVEVRGKHLRGASLRSRAFPLRRGDPTPPVRTMAQNQIESESIVAVVPLRIHIYYLSVRGFICGYRKDPQSPIYSLSAQNPQLFYWGRCLPVVARPCPGDEWVALRNLK